MRIRIATRKSPLALAQTAWVERELRAHHPGIEVEAVTLVTEGDRVLDVPLAKVGGKGLFVSEVEAALVDGRADIAVHSMKDVPESLVDGMDIVCIPEREDPRDVLVSREGLGLFDLSAGDMLGTSSLRRAVQLRRQRPDVGFRVLRGNVGTRLRKLDEGEVQAAVLAYAGLRRLGLDRDRKLTALPIEQSIPAVGQGALAIEARGDDPVIRGLLAPLEHPATRIVTTAERAFLMALHGSCSTPLAAHARLVDGRFTMLAMVASLDGDTLLTASTDVAFDTTSHTAVERARALGTELGGRLLENGAAELVRQAKSEPEPYRFLYSR